MASTKQIKDLNAHSTPDGSEKVPVQLSSGATKYTTIQQMIDALGVTGAKGDAGEDGSTWFHGTGTPSGATGIDGDYYIETDNDNQVYKKASGSWVDQSFNLKGATGATGATGDAVEWVVQAGAPNDVSDGSNGDMYINTTTWDVYGPKAAGAWGSSVGNIKGAAGTGDMNTSTYDPTSVAGDAFDMGNMVESATKKIFTSTERTKLTGIETAATADQTGAEIKTLYEAEADTNAFTDAEKTKLAGIETAADVTDATNVDAAGAVMNSDTTTAAMSFVIDEDTMASNLATKVPTQQSVKAYVDNNTPTTTPTSQQIFTSSGTWTKPSGCKNVLVRIWGGGGGSGGSNSSGNSGAGGGAGYSEMFIDVTGISSATVTVGSAGAGGVSSTANGSAGGNSSWSDGVNTLTANGGGGGLSYSNGGTAGTPGTASGGDRNFAGLKGEGAGAGGASYGHPTPFRDGTTSVAGTYPGVGATSQRDNAAGEPGFRGECIVLEFY